jgi:maltose alpha-D-glucosyltransferase/alpha-amylase
MGELGRYYERALTERRSEPPEVDDPSLMARASRPPPLPAEDPLGHYADSALLLGRRTAEMHLAFAGSDDPAFSCEPYSSFDQRSLYQSLRNLVGRVTRALRQRLGDLPPRAGTLGRELLAREAEVLVRFQPLLERRIHSQRTRCHGDYHLGQVLYTGKDFVLIDFDGGGAHDVAERRRKRSPLRDVAGMIRSFHYAAHVSLSEGAVVREEDRAVLAPWVEDWHARASAAFLRGYRERAAGAPFLPETEEELAMLLDRFVLQKAFHELGDELTEPSDRAAVPILGILQMLGAPPAPR